MASEDTMAESLEELEDFSDFGSDFEATIKPAKRKKKTVAVPQPPKRPRRKAAWMTSTPTSTDPSLLQPPRGTSRQASPRSVTVAKQPGQDISAEDIYGAVCSGKSAMVTIVDEWLDSYKRSKEEGLLVLINFIVQSCGCKGVVSREMLDTMEYADIISRLTREFNEDSVTYPLCTTGSKLRRFKGGLCEFARVLVHSCRNSIIYDEYLFPSLLALLTGLSDSQVRAFRHTSTLLAMKLMTGLVEVTVTVSVQLSTTQRRIDLENAKETNERASDRLEELQANISELQENRAELSSMMNGIFRGVFVNRYRDQQAEIRVVCIEELGVWLTTDPQNFLNDGCIKYLGWTLHDKQSPVRLQCVRALQGLYQEEEFIGRLELFTSRFKERMLSMVLDKDPDVAVEAVNLLLLIQKRIEGELGEEECGHIYPLVYASHRGLASAAATLLYNKLKSVITSEKQDGDNSNGIDFCRIIVTFFIQSEFHDHAAYLVDSLWEAAGSELRDWETMTTLLLQENGLMDEEEGALIEVMTCAIRQAAQATPPVGRTQGKKLLSMKDKKVQEQDRRRLTTHFIPLLPQLLAKYSADAVKVTLLLKAPLHFDLDMYSSSPPLEKHLHLLLSQVCSILDKHTEASVLDACAHLASTLCTAHYTFSSRAHLAFSQLLDGLTECFNSYLSDLLQGTADENDTYNAGTVLRRITALCSAMDPTGWKLFDPCVELLKNRMESSELNMDLLISALRLVASHLMWAKVNAINSTPPEADLVRLKREVHSFCRVCRTCLSVNQPEIRDLAFQLLCDLLLLYSPTAARFSGLQSLVYLPSSALCAEMAAFTLDYIFSETEDTDIDAQDEEEMRMTLLRTKRNQLAGYCKLILYGVLDISAATNVFKHYNKYYKDFGDIIKETITKSKLINPTLSARTVCLSLQQLFSEMLTQDPRLEDLNEMRDLARKLATSFGIDLHRVRKPVMALHTDGICFAFREGHWGNAPFLEILSEFSCKLLHQDCAQIVAFLKAQCPRAALSWPSVKMYKRSLQLRSSARTRGQEEASDALSPYQTPGAKRRKTAAPPGSGSSIARRTQLDSSSIPSSLPTPDLPTPDLASTAERQPAPKKPAAPGSDVGSIFSEPESEDEFSSGSHMRKVKPTKRRLLSSRHASSIMDQQDLSSNLTLLSLIEDQNGEREEPEIEEYKSDSENETENTQQAARYTSASVFDELFD